MKREWLCPKAKDKTCRRYLLCFHGSKPHPKHETCLWVRSVQARREREGGIT